MNLYDVIQLFDPVSSKPALYNDVVHCVNLGLFFCSYSLVECSRGKKACVLPQKPMEIIQMANLR